MTSRSSSTTIYNLPNALSLLRAPLALLFLIENVPLRLGVIFLAMVTDSLDGFFARRWRSSTLFGRILDPAMDKFFVFFTLGVLLWENRLESWQACAMIARDFSLCLFGLYLTVWGNWQAYECRAIRWGKVTTALQYVVLMGLTLHYVFPWYIYALFILLASLAFLELYQLNKSRAWKKP